MREAAVEVVAPADFTGAVVLTGKLPVAKAGEKVLLRAEVLTRTGTKQTRCR